MVLLPVGLLLRGNEVDVVGNKELPHACHRCTPARHEVRGTKIRLPFALT